MVPQKNESLSIVCSLWQCASQASLVVPLFSLVSSLVLVLVPCGEHPGVAPARTAARKRPSLLVGGGLLQWWPLHTAKVATMVGYCNRGHTAHSLGQTSTNFCAACSTMGCCNSTDLAKCELNVGHRVKHCPLSKGTHCAQISFPH